MSTGQNQSRVEADADVTRERDNLIRLQLRRNELQAQINAAEKEKTDSDTLLDRAARALVGGQAEPSQTKVAELNTQLDVAARAIELQSKALDTARAIAARRLAEAQLPEYRKLVKAVGKALDTLRPAIDAERRFVGALHSEGCTLVNYFPTCPIGLMPENLDKWRENAERAGHI